MKGPIPERVIDRVMNRWVEQNGCWISGYKPRPDGYVLLTWVEGGMPRHEYAHRVAWYATSRVVIPPGMTVDHMCHVPACINPTHLRLLTPSANSQAKTVVVTRNADSQPRNHNVVSLADRRRATRERESQE